ncbi:hypothetical protein [Streptomyces sp. NPDC127084]|uniref:hypothetical protein n=1 Tax=Streptomyces sp. NPDC127084 TaxID=3347133 RepID=UPI0036622D4B
MSTPVRPGGWGLPRPARAEGNSRNRDEPGPAALGSTAAVPLTVAKVPSPHGGTPAAVQRHPLPVPAPAPGGPGPYPAVRRDGRGDELPPTVQRAATTGPVQRPDTATTHRPATVLDSPAGIAPGTGRPQSFGPVRPTPGHPVLPPSGSVPPPVTVAPPPVQRTPATSRAATPPFPPAVQRSATAPPMPPPPPTPPSPPPALQRRAAGPPPRTPKGTDGDTPSPGKPADFDARALTGAQIDELTHRLIGPLTRLLRTELRLDRERTGRLRDPRH